MTKLIRTQLTFLLYGFVFWLPLSLVIYISALLFGSAERIGRWLLDLFVADRYLFTGFGTIVCILIIFASGVILKTTRVGGLLSRIPLLGLFFGQGEVISIGRLLNLQPCLFLLSSTCISYGWILSQERVQLTDEKVDFPLLNVYYPNVPTLITGSVFALRKEIVIRLGNPSAEVINLLLYAFRSPACLKYLPWDDETPAEFRERAKLFGLRSDIAEETSRAQAKQP